MQSGTPGAAATCDKAIDSVHSSQRAAALAPGLSGVQAMRFVILPEAARPVVP